MAKYKIQWRQAGSFRVITGLRQYDSQEQAQRQITRFLTYFPTNRYYITWDVA